ncbi:MAG: CoA-binding protein [Omnitrophica WOR_2 bacterium]|jgi:predicted CoA-binding protein
MTKSDKLTLVLGASLNVSRFSNICIRTLVDNNIPTLALGLREGEVSGVHIKTGFPSFNDIDTITLYLGPKNQKSFYDYIIDLKPKRIIFNPGTWNQELVTLAKENNIEVVNNCTLMMISGGYY